MRKSASLSGRYIATERTNVTGTVIAGPTSASGYTWWEIKWANGVTGWSVANYCALITPVTAESLDSGATIATAPSPSVSQTADVSENTATLLRLLNEAVQLLEQKVGSGQ